MVTIEVRLPKEIYDKASEILARQGLTMEDALILFFQETARLGRIPFEYIRTSMNASQTSADDQYCAISDYCEEHDVKLDSVYTVAGTPEFASKYLDQIIEEMQKNSCNTLIIASRSRLGRNHEQASKQLEKFSDCGIRVCSAQDDLIANKDNVPEKDIDDEEAQDDGFRMSM